MPKQVRLPDGQIGIFGDDESNQQIRAKIEQKYPNAYPDPGVLPAIGRGLRGAGRAVAGGLADAYALSDVPGIGALGPGTALRLSQKIPGGTALRHKVEDFASAKMPTTEENVGWWGVQGLEALALPAEKLPLELGARGGRYLAGKFAPKLRELAEESARQTATQTGEKVGGKVAEKVGEQAIKKPKLRMKADGSIVEVRPDGTEQTVRQWTKRRMEKLGQRARGEPTSSTARPTQEGVHQEYQQLLDKIGDHGVHHVAGYFAKAMGIPRWTAHLIMMQGPRRVLDRGIATGAIGTTQKMMDEQPANERRARTPENNPPALPPFSGSPL